MLAPHLTFIPSAPPLVRPSVLHPPRRNRLPAFRPARVTIVRVTVHAAARNDPPSDSSNPSGSHLPHQSVEKDEPTKGASRTLLGRLLVEVLSLIVGALLLLVVVAWRASQVVSLNVWRALIWLAGVRRLGKWAFSRLTAVDRLTVPVSSMLHAVKRAYDAAFAAAPTSPSTTTTSETPMRRAEGEGIEEEDHIVDNGPVVVGRSAKPSGRRLILVRHAKTLWDRESETPDHDRVLSARGKEEARVVGAELARRAWTPDVVLCSDAVRTVQTLSLLDVDAGGEAGKGAATTCTESLYYAVTGDEMAMAVDDALVGRGFRWDTTLLVVCHNPGCEELVEQLTGQRPDMGTGCAALLEYVDEDDEVESAKQSTFHLKRQSGQWTLSELIRPSVLLSASSWLDDQRERK